MKGFVKISKYSGMREDLVQAGGGNSSFKISENKMAIKASGYQLADITETEGYALVDVKSIRDAFFETDSLELLTDEDGQAILNNALIEGDKPSIETFLHSMSGKYTLHTHPIVVNALTCRKNGMKVLKMLFPEALFVPYATPGMHLAKEYFKAYQQASDGCEEVYDIVFLQNHGLLVSADTADAVIKKNEYVVKVLEDYLMADYKEYHALTKIWEYFEENIIWKVTDWNVLKAYGRKNQIWQHTFCPDCVVFLGKKLLQLPDDFTQEDINGFCANYGQPVMVEYRKKLYIIAKSVKKAWEIQSVMSFSAQVMTLNEGLESNLLSEEDQDFLINWDAEKYRKLMK